METHPAPASPQTARGDRNGLIADASARSPGAADAEPAAQEFERVLQREADAIAAQRDGRESARREDRSDDEVAIAALCARLMPGPTGSVASASPPPAAAACALDAAWSQLSDYVERWLVDSSAAGSGAPAALLRLRDDLFADTAVALTRSDHGWLLRIDSADARLRTGALDRHEAALRARFAQRGLGRLTIEHGELSLGTAPF